MGVKVGYSIAGFGSRQEIEFGVLGRLKSVRWVLNREESDNAGSPGVVT